MFTLVKCVIILIDHLTFATPDGLEKRTQNISLCLPSFLPSFLPSVFCCRAGSGYPSAVSPHCPFCSCLLECYVVTVHGQIMKHLRSFSASSLFTHHSAFMVKIAQMLLVISNNVVTNCCCCLLRCEGLAATWSRT